MKAYFNYSSLPANIQDKVRKLDPTPDDGMISTDDVDYLSPARGGGGLKELSAILQTTRPSIPTLFKPTKSLTFDSVRTEYAERRKTFLQQARLLHERGHRFKAEHHLKINRLTIYSGFSPITIEIREAGNIYQENDGDPNSPLELKYKHCVKYQHGKATNYNHSSVIPISPVTVHLRSIGDENEIIMWDWFEEKPFYAVRIRKDSDVILDNEVRKSMELALENHERSFDIDKAVAELPHFSVDKLEEINRETVYQYDYPEGWSADQVKRARESWATLSERFQFGLTATALDDQFAQHPIAEFLLLNSSDISASAVVLDPLRADGVPVINGIKCFIHFVILGGTSKLPKLQEAIVDKYGNDVAPLIRGGRLNGFLVEIGPAYSDQPGARSFKAIGIDLSAFGFGNYPELLAVRTLPPEKVPESQSPYFFHITYPFPPKDALITVVTDQTSETERLLGYKPGILIKRVLCFDAILPNASTLGSDSFSIGGERADDIARGNNLYTVSHEIFHVFDRQFKISEDMVFRDLYERIPALANFFRNINESSTFPENHGGHSEDDAKEFFASLINSLRSPKWDEWSKKLDPGDRLFYAHALRTADLAMRKRVSQYLSSPLRALLHDRLRQLGEVPPIAVPILGPIIDGAIRLFCHA